MFLEAFQGKPPAVMIVVSVRLNQDSLVELAQCSFRLSEPDAAVTYPEIARRILQLDGEKQALYRLIEAALPVKLFAPVVVLFPGCLPGRSGAS